MKTITKTLALISLLLLGCAGMTGQKNLLLQDIRPLMSYSAESRSNIILTGENNLNNFNFYVEEEIEVKDWMLNNHEWFVADRLETEKELSVEDWMISSFSGNDNWLSKLVEEDEELPVKLQDWMLCCKEWQATSF